MVGFNAVHEQSNWSEAQVAEIIGYILRTGVMVAATLVSIGGILYLQHYGLSVPNYKSFQSEPEELRTISGIMRAAFALRSQGIIQLGLLLLMAVPFIRVAFSAFAFAMQRDYMYVTITLFVLILLLYSLFHG